MVKGRNKALMLFVLIAALMLGTAFASTIITPTGLKTIDEEAFCGDTSISRVVLEDGIKAIGSRAFADSSISELILPLSIKSIAEDAFEGCGEINVYVDPYSAGCDIIKALKASGHIQGRIRTMYILEENGKLCGNIREGQQVFLSFTAPKAGAYTFYGTSVIGSHAEMFDIDGNSIGNDDDSYDGRNYYITKTMSAGEHVFLRAGLDGDNKAGYIGCFVETGTSPKPVGFEGGSREVTVPAGEYVRYKFTASDASNYVIHVTTGKGVSVRLRLEDAYWTIEGDEEERETFVNCRYLEENESMFIDVFNKTGSAVTRTVSLSYANMGLSLGRNTYYFYAGENGHLIFTAEKAGRYTFYSTGDQDTCATVYDTKDNVVAKSDNEGENFRVSCEMAAGDMVAVDVKFRDTTYAGYMTIMAVENGSDSVELPLGSNSIHVQAGKKAYGEFVAPVTGTYTFTSAGSNDTYAALYSMEGIQLAADDNSGSDDNFLMTAALEAGDRVTLAVKYNDAALAGNMDVAVTLPNISAGDNSVSVAAGKVTYNMFTAPAAGTYTFMSSGSETSVGCLLSADGTRIADGTDSGDGRNYTITHTCKSGEILILGTGYSDAAASGTVTVNVSGVPTGTTYRALLIGQVSFNPLCKRNAGDVAILANVLSTVNEDYTVTKRIDLTKSEVKEAITDAFSGADDDDVSLFFYASHGVTSGKGTEYYGALCTYNDEYISTAEITEWLAAVPGKVIVMCGTCGSGALVVNEDGETVDSFDYDAFSRAFVSAFAEADPGIPVFDPDAQAGDFDSNSAEMRQEKFCVLTAANAGESSFGWEYVSSDLLNYRNLFGIALGKGIGTGDDSTMQADADSNKQLTLNELYTYTKDYIYTYCSNHGSMDSLFTPQVYPENSSYVLFTK